MTITDFATQHRLKTKHDKGDDTTIISGKAGQLYEYSDEEFAVMYILPATKPARPRVWNRMRDLCVAAGMVLRQNGDTEGAFSFNPENREHVQLAIKLAGVKRKRQMSEKQKAVAEAALRLEWRRSARGMRVHQCLRSFGGRREKKLDTWCSVLVIYNSICERWLVRADCAQNSPKENET